MNWLAMIALAATILSAFLGYKRGFVKTVISMVFLLLVLLVSGWISPYIGSYLSGNTKLVQKVHESCEKMVEDAIEEAEKSKKELPGQDEILEKLGIPQTIIEKIPELQLVQGPEDGKKEQIIQKMADYLTKKVLQGIVFVVSLLVSWVAVKIVMVVLEGIAKLPVLSLANRIAGAGAGVIRVFLWIWIFYLLLVIFAGTSWSQTCMKAVRESEFLSLLYQNNPLLQIVLHFLR